MEEPRLTTDIWVKAHLRQCMARNLPAYVLRKGAEAGATVLLKVNRLEQGCQLLSQARDLDGNLGWLAAFDGALVPEAEADAYIERAVGRDPDLWVIEVESRTGEHPFPGKVM
ncbi:hypothetical protein BCL74_0507 [Oceanibaculum indicum]|jgi:hypothetical protein|uniref:DUF1491 family protein n=1 Tax=Oceanibaculum indicum TaxID=526216 RepID=A0A420WNZ4_9PROT|nr:hypothetical protein BCL74_0507 [Oceanibaculum indicum]